MKSHSSNKGWKYLRNWGIKEADKNLNVFTDFKWLHNIQKSVC